jgi:protein SDA1
VTALFTFFQLLFFFFFSGLNRIAAPTWFITMGRRNRSALLPTNIPQLQNLLKRDPKSYEAEFEQQYRHYEASLSIFKLKPDDEAKDLGELINFISQVSQCFPQRTAEFPGQMIELLQEHYQVLNPDLRKNMVQALILLRNKNVVDNTRYVVYCSR